MYQNYQSQSTFADQTIN